MRPPTPLEKIRTRTERLLRINGAHRTGIIQDELEGQLSIAFELDGQRVSLHLEFPSAKSIYLGAVQSSKSFLSWTERRRIDWATRKSLQYEEQLWRAVYRLLRAKFEFIHLGQTTVEKEFLGYLINSKGKSPATNNPGPLARRPQVSHDE